HRLKAGDRFIDTTEDHQIYVDGQGWKEAVSIRGGERLLSLREEFLDKEGWKNNINVLLQTVRSQRCVLESGGRQEDFQSTKETASNENLSGVRHSFPAKGSQNHIQKSKVLFPKLF